MLFVNLITPEGFSTNPLGVAKYLPLALEDSVPLLRKRLEGGHSILKAFYGHNGLGRGWGKPQARESNWQIF